MSNGQISEELFCPILIQKIIESKKNQLNIFKTLQKINKHFLNEHIKYNMEQSLLQQEIQELYKKAKKTTNLGNIIYNINVQILEYCLKDLKNTLHYLNSPQIIENSQVEEKLIEPLNNQEEEDLEFISSIQKRREIITQEDRLHLGDLFLQQKENAEAQESFLNNTDIFLEDEEKQTPRNLWNR
jgi:inorganic triphosphatase YgiF